MSESRMTGSPSRSTRPPPPPPAATTFEPRGPRPGRIVGILVVVMAVVSAVVLVASRGGDRAAARPLALAFTEGRSERYSIHQTMDATIAGDGLGEQAFTMEMTQDVTWSVVDVDADGVATVELATTDLAGTVNGETLPVDAADVPTLEFRIAPDGRIVSAGGLAFGGAGQPHGFGFPGMGQITPILPDPGAEVAPGDTWEKEFSQDVPFGGGSIRFTAKSRYDRNQMVDGRTAAVIVTQMDVPLDFTLRLSELMSSLGRELGATGATGMEALADATFEYGGGGTFRQTSFVDLGAEEVLRTRSSGEFDITMTIAGVPAIEGQITFGGSFTQELERR